MIRTPISYNSFALNAGGFNAKFDDANNQARDLDVDVSLVARAGTTPSLASKQIKEKLYIVSVNLTDGGDASYAALSAALDPTDETEHQLVATDESGKQWYVMATLSKPPMRTSPLVVNLVFLATDGIWRSVDPVEQTWNVTASGQSVTLQNDGSRDAYPVFEITPTLAKVGGFFYRRWCPIWNPLTTVQQEDAVDLTQGGLDTAALVGAGKMQIDGDDLRIFQNGAEVERWLADMNGASTKVWSNVLLHPGVQVTLKYALDNVSDYPIIDIPTSAANLAMLTRMKAATNKVFVVLTGGVIEAFTYTGVDLAEYDVLGVARAQKGTSMIAHSAGDPVIWIEHDIWMYYGNSSLEAPTTDDTRKPIFDLSSSTISSRVCTEMAAFSNLRMGSFKSAILASSGKLSVTYTGNHGDTSTDPATELGLSIRGWTKSGVWQAESATLEWRFYHPAGITHVSSNGEKYRYSASWPTVALQKSTDGKNWTNQWTLPTPAALQTWEAWTKAGEALGAGYSHVRFLSTGSITAAANNDASWEVEGHTLTLNSSNVIQGKFGVEIVNYELDVVLYNAATGEMVRLRWSMGLNTVLTVDSDQGFITYEDGANAYNAMSRPAGQVDWLRLQPGANQLYFTDAGTAGVTVDISYEERVTP